MVVSFFKIAVRNHNTGTKQESEQSTQQMRTESEQSPKQKKKNIANKTWFKY
jgi:hypothetical protein